MSSKVFVPSNKPFEEMEKEFLPNLLDYYKYPEKYASEPFRIFGNLYYVGDTKVCCHLVDTGSGLILFDTGYAHTMHILISNIQKLGFSPKDIKVIVHSHGHFDHFGCSQRMKKLYGCKIYMGKPDAERLRINPRAALMELSPEPYGPIPETDIELNDGDIISLGNVNIRCVSASGHTEGVMAFFFQATDKATIKQVGYWGGVGFFTMYRTYLEKYNLPLNLPKRMEETIKKLRFEKVDITLGNHPANNNTIEKYKRMCQNPQDNPFLDATVWEDLLNATQKRLDDFIEKNY